MKKLLLIVFIASCGRGPASCPVKAVNDSHQTRGDKTCELPK